MTTIYGPLAQAAPGAADLINLYVVPIQQRIEGARVICTNRGSSIAAARVALAPGGATDSPAQYIAYDKPVEAFDTVSSVEFQAGERTVIRVRSDTGEMSFTLIGVETTLR